MRSRLSDFIEDARCVLDPNLGTPPYSGPLGFFYPVICPLTGGHLKIVASDGNKPGSEGWDHVSVSLADRTPTWEEMNWVKEQFWEDEEVAYQLHPPKSQYISNHPYCLHIWSNAKHPVKLPPSIFVGVKSEGTFKNAEQARAAARRHGIGIGFSKRRP